MPQASPVMAGLKCRCFNCGEGRVFRGYLTLKSRCETCGQDFTAADPADGPAFFAMFAALILFGPFAFILPLTGWPVWALVPAYLLLIGAMIAFVLWLLRPLKAILLNLQLHHKAEEAQFEDDR
ncbi:MAG: DUF983 domain-containing protein [Alphaproteobacteria bacterium]|nr:DUF983 domain-containing protein [Alphaproteobacteria bacterium]